MNWNLQNLQNNDFFNIPIFQIPVSHDHVFGEYTCKATNKMGTLRRKVLLKEGAKPGIPALDYKTINTDSVEMTILVSTSIVVFDGMFSKDSRNLSQFLKEHPAELHLRIIGFEIQYKEKNWTWSESYHQYFHKGMKI